MEEEVVRPSSNLQEKKVVTCFLESDGEILVLRRSDGVSTYQDRWAGQSVFCSAMVDAHIFRLWRRSIRPFTNATALSP